jgi:hypothetical protein
VAFQDEHITSFREVGESSQVESQDLKSVKDWFLEYQKAVNEPERKYLDTGDDLIYVLEKTNRPWLQSMLCSQLVNKLGFFRRHPTDESAYDPERVFLQEKDRADRFLAVLMLPFGLFMLIGPLWILYIVNSAERRLGIITGFIVLFAALVFSATRAKIFEGLAATAG